MPNTLKHEDIYPGMSFKNKDGDVCKVVYIGKDDESGIPFLVVTGQLKYHENNDWLSINELNELEFLGIQTEPVQLGVAECLVSIYDCFIKGNRYPYFGHDKIKGMFLRDYQRDTSCAHSPHFELINGPDIPKEITMHGKQWVPKGKT